MDFENFEIHTLPKQKTKKYMFSDYFETIKWLKSIPDIRGINELVCYVLDKFRNNYDRNETTICIPKKITKWSFWLGYDTIINFYDHNISNIPEGNYNNMNFLGYMPLNILSEEKKDKNKNDISFIYYDEEYVAHDVDINIYYQRKNRIFPIAQSLQNIFANIYQSRIKCISNREFALQKNKNNYQKFLKMLKADPDNYYLSTLRYFFKEYTDHEITTIYKDLVQNKSVLKQYVDKWYNLDYLIQIMRHNTAYRKGYPLQDYADIDIRDYKIYESLISDIFSSDKKIDTYPDDTFVINEGEPGAEIFKIIFRNIEKQHSRFTYLIENNLLIQNQKNDITYIQDRFYDAYTQAKVGAINKSYNVYDRIDFSKAYSYMKKTLKNVLSDFVTTYLRNDRRRR